ncbi:MAG: hypothetical protein NVS9B10_13260 [Nevskia sp.]
MPAAVMNRFIVFSAGITAPTMTCLDLKVSPEATRAAPCGWLDGALKFSVTAAPERGRRAKTRHVEHAIAGKAELRRRIDAHRR